MYSVINDFTDLRDGGRYRAGDEFPRAGVTVSPERLKELSSRDNRRGIPLIAIDEGGSVKKGKKSEKD